MSVPRSVTLRKAVLSDFARLFYWRNDAETREMFIHQNIVTMDEHWNWLTEIVKDESSALFIAEDCVRADTHIPVGTIRAFMRNDGAVVLSVTVAPLFRRHGYGRAMIAALLEHMRGAPKFIAEVKEHNYVSLAAFASCGFVPTECVNRNIQDGGAMVILECRV